MTLYPRSGLLQGAEPYLRALASRKGTLPDVVARLRTAIAEWDEAQRGCVTAAESAAL